MTRRCFRTWMVPVALVAGAALTVMVLLPAARQAGAAAEDDPTKNKPAPAPAEAEQAIRDASAAYVRTLNKGELPAVMAYWAADADYVDETGKLTRGRNAIAALFEKSLPELKGATMTGTIHSLKFLRPEVALVDGSVEIAAADGSKQSNRYAVVWVKSGTQWLISSARDMPGGDNDLQSFAAAQLKPLEWLVGEWEGAGSKGEVQMNCRWAPNKSFLLLEYKLNRDAFEDLLVSVRIGWDAHNGMLRSWVFDSQGGFGEGYWERSGNRWTVASAGILHDGGTGGATHVWEFIDANSYVWRATDREVDGQPLADTEVKFVRRQTKNEGGKP